MALEASETPDSSGGRTITFLAHDAGDPIAGATVQVGPKTLTTGSDGTAKLTQTDAITVTAVAEKAGYAPAETEI